MKELCLIPAPFARIQNRHSSYLLYIVDQNGILQRSHCKYLRRHVLLTSDMVKNAKQLPKVFYGLHAYPGPAEYEEPGTPAYRIMLNEQTLRDMDLTFKGCPVYVRHREEVNLDRLQEEADGYVIRSFYNEADGKHWAEFLVVSDRGFEAVGKGWRLSNAYIPESFGAAGVWNGVTYDREVTKARFEHLAIVPDPRYQESVVLTPEQFRAYNDAQVTALRRVANDRDRQKDKRSVFSFFKTTKVENADEVGNILVTLPSGKTVTISQLVNAASEEKPADKKEQEKNATEEKKAPPDPKTPEEKTKQGETEEKPGAAPQMANMDHHVQVGNGTMAVKDLVAKHSQMQGYMDAMSTHHAELTKKQSADEDGGETDASKAGGAQTADKTERNADEDGGEKEAGSQLKESDKTTRNSKFFKDLKNAHETQAADQVAIVDMDLLARGQRRYGSNP